MSLLGSVSSYMSLPVLDFFFVVFFCLFFVFVFFVFVFVTIAYPTALIPYCFLQKKGLLKTKHTITTSLLLYDLIIVWPILSIAHNWQCYKGRVLTEYRFWDSLAKLQYYFEDGGLNLPKIGLLKGRSWVTWSEEMSEKKNRWPKARFHLLCMTWNKILTSCPFTSSPGVTQNCFVN